MPLNAPNIGHISHVASSGPRGNVFKTLATKFKAKKSAAAKKAPAAPTASYPKGPQKPAPMPAPSASMGQQMAAGRAARQQRAQQNRQQAGPNLINRINSQTGSYKGATPVSGQTAFRQHSTGATASQANAFTTRMKAQAAGLSAQQSNMAHGPATPASTPTQHNVSSAQFSGGSSRQAMPNATRAASTPGRPNTITHGSNKPNASKQGVAAMGSHLAASAAQMQTQVRKETGHQRAMASMPAPNVGKGSQTYFPGMPKKGPKPPRQAPNRNLQSKQFGGPSEGQGTLF